MIDKLEQKKAVDAILVSKEFVHSKTTQDLLAFLVKSTAKGVTVKESTIAMEVFGKDHNFNPTEDTIVRVHMHSLRKKLDNYYLDEGKEEKIRLVIPKGRYDIHYEAAKVGKSSGDRNLLRIPKIILVSLLLTSFLIIIALLIQNNRIRNLAESYQRIGTQDPIWKEFLSPQPTLIVFGDHFFYAKYSKRTKQATQVRDVHINSEEELARYIKNNQDPDVEISKSTISYLSKHAAWSMQYILPVFFAIHKRVNFKLASDLTWEDIRRNNIVFIGSTKTLGLLNRFLSQTDITCDLFPHRVVVRKNQQDTIHVFNAQYRDQTYYKDFATVAKLPGPNHNSILIITSYYFVGVIEAIINLTDPALLRQFESTLQPQPSDKPLYFEAVFEVIGYDNTNLQSKPVYALKLESNLALE